MKPVDGLASILEKLVDDKIAKALRGGSRTVPAEVAGTDGEGKIWVSLPGAESPTPVKRSSVEVSQGDIVSVTVGNGMAVIDSNLSNPSAGLARVVETQETANKAMDSAGVAYEAADAARKSAGAAAEMAKSASSAATTAYGAATNAQASAARAQGMADSAAQASVAAREDAAVANEAATQAIADAASAKDSAEHASIYATSALGQLGVVQDVVGVLSWACEHGSFDLTADTEIVPGKTYFTYDQAEGDYTPVVDPKESELSTYYELTVSEAMQSFIMAHLAVTSRGLWVLPSGITYELTADTEVVEGTVYYEETGSGTPEDPTVYVEVVPVGDENPSEEGWFVHTPQTSAGHKVLISSEGMTVYNEIGIPVAEYTDSVTLGIPSEYHMVLDSSGINAYNGDGTLAPIHGSNIDADRARIEALEANSVTTETITVMQGDIDELSDGINAQLEQIDGTISSMKDDYDGQILGLNGQIEDAKSESDIAFDQVNESIGALQGLTAEHSESLRAIGTFTEIGAGFVALGLSGSPITTRLTNSGLEFWADGEDTPIAYLIVDETDNAGKLYITNAVVVQDLQLGDWIWTARKNGHLTLKWIGE